MTTLTRREFGSSLGVVAVASVVPELPGSLATRDAAFYRLCELSVVCAEGLTRIASLASMNSRRPAADYDAAIHDAVAALRPLADQFMRTPSADPEILARKRRLLDYATRNEALLPRETAQAFTRDIARWTAALTHDARRTA